MPSNEASGIRPGTPVTRVGAMEPWARGATAFVRTLASIGVEPTSFEIFDGAHGAIEYRWPLALRHLAERLAP